MTIPPKLKTPPLCISLLAITLFTQVLTAEFKAGISSKIVTPNPLQSISGGVGPSHPVTGKRGDLRATALALQSGPETLVIVSVDFLGFPAALGDKIRAMVPSVPKDRILIGATHTHSAPDCYGFPNGRGGIEADFVYLDWVCTQAAAAIQSALDTLQPARLKIATGEANGKIAYNYYAEALFDPRCSVMQAIDGKGRPIATLVNYAIHPEVLGPRSGFVSPDVIGPLYQRVKELGGGTCIFMNGALGGMITADNRTENGPETQSWAECQRIGHLLAEESLRIVSDATIEDSPQLKVVSDRIAFPVDSPDLQAIMKISPLDFQVNAKGHIVTTINAAKIGSATILTIPGEALPNLGAYLKRKINGDHDFLFGLTNDAFGYILAREDWGAFDRYGYVSSTSLGEETGPILMQQGLSLIEKLNNE
jgi:hypothetical protein